MSDQKALDDSFDFIIVGGGAAGCVTAEKLSRHFSCLLIEAGGDDAHPAIEQHDQWFTCATNAELTWALPTVPQAHLDARQLNPNMGRVVGGSTSINAMYWVRGNLLDFERWETIYHCSGWNADRFLQAYRALEKTADGDDRLHGRTGHIEVRQAPENPAFHSFAEACKHVGVPFTPDSNSDKQLGYSLGMDEWVEAEIGDRPHGIELEDYVRKNSISQWHPVGTCSMRSHPD